MDTPEHILGIIDQRTLALSLGVTVGTLREWRRTGKGPPFARLEKAVVYRLEDVQAWIRSRLTSTPEKAPARD